MDFYNIEHPKPYPSFSTKYVNIAAKESDLPHWLHHPTAPACVGAIKAQPHLRIARSRQVENLIINVGQSPVTHPNIKEETFDGAQFRESTPVAEARMRLSGVRPVDRLDWLHDCTDISRASREARGHASLADHILHRCWINLL